MTRAFTHAFCVRLRYERRSHEYIDSALRTRIVFASSHVYLCIDRDAEPRVVFAQRRRRLCERVGAAVVLRRAGRATRARDATRTGWALKATRISNAFDALYFEKTSPPSFPRRSRARRASSPCTRRARAARARQREKRRRPLARRVAPDAGVVRQREVGNPFGDVAVRERNEQRAGVRRQLVVQASQIRDAASADAASRRRRRARRGTRPARRARPA